MSSTRKSKTPSQFYIIQPEYRETSAEVRPICQFALDVYITIGSVFGVYCRGFQPVKL